MRLYKGEVILVADLQEWPPETIRVFLKLLLPCTYC